MIEQLLRFYGLRKPLWPERREIIDVEYEDLSDQILTKEIEYEEKVDEIDSELLIPEEA